MSGPRLNVTNSAKRRTWPRSGISGFAAATSVAASATSSKSRRKRRSRSGPKHFRGDRSERRAWQQPGVRRTFDSSRAYAPYRLFPGSENYYATFARNRMPKSRRRVGLRKSKSTLKLSSVTWRTTLNGVGQRGSFSQTFQKSGRALQWSDRVQ
jgi:hypothetical protein